MRELSKKLEELNSEMTDHELVENTEPIVVSEYTDGIDELHITVKHENLDEMKEYINGYDYQIGILNINDMNIWKPEIEDEDKYKLKVGAAMRM